MKHSLLSVPIFFLLLSLVAKGADKQESPPYLIGREDVLDIIVWQSPDLTKALPVRSDGTIEYPLLGSVPAAGLTTADLQKTVRERLAQGYVKDPQVSVSVKEYNSKKILVFGQVGKAGLFKLKGPMPLLEILFMVGGVGSDAKRLTVIRPNQVSVDANPAWPAPPSEGKNPAESATTFEINLIAMLSEGDLSQNIMINPGDTLYFASGTGLRYYVLGQVGNPGPYEWIRDITALEAIKLAGGVKDRGAPNRIKIRKMYKGQKQEIKVNLVDIMKGKKKDDTIIKPGDTIIVPESWI